MYKTPSHKINPQRLIELAKDIDISASKQVSLEEAVKLLNISEAYAKSFLIAGIELKILEDLEDGKVTTSDEWKKLSQEIGHGKEKYVYAKFLQKYKPFENYYYYLNQGLDSNKAFSKMCAVLGIGKTTAVYRDNLEIWGGFAEFLEIKNGKISPKIRYEPVSIEISNNELKQLKNSANARAFLQNRLTMEVFNYLKEDEIQELITAIFNLGSDRHIRATIDAAGRALEDFLRRYAKGNGINTKNCSGIEELANELYSDKNHARLVHDKHRKILIGLSSIRVASAHGKEKSSLERWTLRSQLMLPYILLVIDTIRSVYEYGNKNQLTL